MKDILQLLIKLEATEEFREWREKIAKPELEKIDQMKMNVLGLSEADVKAAILYENYIKDLFYKSFERAKIQINLEEEQKDRE